MKMKVQHTRTFEIKLRIKFMCTVMVVLGCQSDCIWNELNSGNGVHTCHPDLEAERHRPVIQILRLEGTPLL